MSDYHVNKFARLHCHLRDQVEKHQFLNALQVVGEMNLMLIEALKSSRGNMAKAARLIGITERRMGLRMQRHGIDPRRFRT